MHQLSKRKRREKQEKAIFYGAGSKVHALLRNHDFLEAFMVRAHYMQPQKPAVTEK